MKLETIKLYLILIALITGFSIGLYLIILLNTSGLTPEASPISTAANYMLDNQCNSCHFNIKQKTITAEDYAANHNDLHIEKEYLNAYLTAIKVSNNLSDRIKKSNNSLIKGEQLAEKHRCFTCHGLYGQGGQANKGALKNYIPGWFGNDFDLLTNTGNHESIRDWIKNGTNNNLINEPFTGWIARYYLNKQEIKMLKLSNINTIDIELLVNYVKAIREYGPMDVETILEYEKDSIKTKLVNKNITTKSLVNNTPKNTHFSIF
ncbi:MAG: hypothetical protein DIZ80_00055 [endosymbiont of Galathealinum brachiosum]|uniref:Cytochrome c domain-containing protein n=1 Tax=endosymbiont of Galathealinum brachiosum TaxID=2200906 RepID=A0A370DP35_9GAMM|nr:MAG: hypothetical protein DIZ80_00055 [endosymbiont of Galathealinum brachiosum]